MHNYKGLNLICDSGGTRTHNQQNRNLPFYPLNYGAVTAKIQISAKIQYWLRNTSEFFLFKSSIIQNLCFLLLHFE